MTGKERELAHAIRQIALKGLLDNNGNLKAASETRGYVTKIHDDPDDELYGTVDVREYFDETYNNKGDDDINMRGLHEGVFLSVIQNLENGVYFIPKLWSDVTIVQDSITKREYVKMFNHVDVLNYEAGTKVGIGVIEREEYDIKDFDEHEEKEETGNKAWLGFTKEAMVATVENEDGDKVEITSKADSIEVKVCDKVTITLKDGKVNIEADDVTIDAKKAKITGGQMEMKGMASTDMQGPFCAIPTCPFSGAPHNGKLVTNT